MLSLSWYGGVDTKDIVAKQVASIHQQVENGVWLCVAREGGSPNKSTQLIGLNIDQCDELGLSLRFYEECLIPLFHHLRRGFSFNYHHYSAYRKWNKGLAEGLASLYRDGDVLWLHDAHWIPLARYLKELQPNLPIGLSLSSSFCGTEVLKTLPVAEELLDDLFYFDLVTFSREADIQNISNAMMDLKGAVTLADKRLKKDNQILKVAAYPPVSFVDRDSLEGQTPEDCFGMSSGDKLVLTVDVPSWFSNRTNRNQAYELFLRDNPALAKDMVFGSLVTPFAINEERVKSIVHQWKGDLDDLNDHWRSYSRKPFRLAISQKWSTSPELLFRSARVFVDLSLGCYTSCHHSDFWWAQDPEDPAVLVVSSLALDGNDLPGALVVHPLDVVGVANAVKQALLMPLSERKFRFEQLGNTFKMLSPERRRAKFTFDVVEQAKKNRLQNSSRAMREQAKTVSH
ncbi:trehalose-6-phosphate synthase [Litoribrevibacter albus]|nr:trehalose-6-phosphate synthase [Litoribrevibacter albus]